MIAGIPTGAVRFALTDGGRNGATLLQDQKGYLFSFNGAYKSGLQRWQCSQRCRLKCRAYVKVETREIDLGSGEAMLVNQHCHPPYKSE